MKKLIVILLSFLAATDYTYGHNGTIKGSVSSKSDNAKLVGATIVIEKLSKGTTTDIFGKFTLPNLPAGSHSIYISYLGYSPTSHTLEVKEGETTYLSTYLEKGIFGLSEVTIAVAKEDPLSTISAIDLNLRPIQNSQEVLRTVPGLFIAQHAGGGKAEQIFLRGFDIDHGTDIALTVDGIPVNMVSHAHGQGYSDLHFLIPETIETIDFEKGPYHADQGNFATAGYASFNTRNFLDKSLLKLEFGKFDTYRAVGLFNLLGDSAKFRHHNMYLATEYLFSNGYFEAPQQLNRVNLFGKYQGMLSPEKYLTVSLSTFQSSWDASGQIPERAIQSGRISRFGAIDATEGGNTSRQNINFKFIQTLSNGSILENQVYVVNYDFELFSNFTFFLNDPVNGDQIRQKENRNIFGYYGSYNHVGSLLGKELKTKAGIGLRHDLIDNSELSRTKGRSTTLSHVQLGDIKETNAFAYISETVELHPQWILNAALRYDQFILNYADKIQTDSSFSRATSYKGKVSPKANLYFTASPNLSFYASAGIGFHSNDTRTSVLNTSNEILPSAYGSDLGMIYKPVPNLLLQTALWALDMDQEFVYVGDEGIVEPSGKTYRYGLDVTVRYQIGRYIFADSDVSLAKPRAKDQPEGNNYIPLAPSLTSTGGINYRSQPNGFNAGLRYRYLKTRPANEGNTLSADGYFLIDAVTSYSKNSFEVKLTIENLLDEELKEAQFETESRLRDEAAPVSEIHFTPGTPFFFKLGASYLF